MRLSVRLQPMVTCHQGLPPHIGLRGRVGLGSENRETSSGSGSVGVVIAKNKTESYQDESSEAGEEREDERDCE